MKKVKKRAEKRGLPPGSLISVGGTGHHALNAHVFVFNETELVETDIPDASAFVQPDPEHSVSWLDLDGIDNIELLSTIGKRFNLHSLLLEDVLNQDHRPKVEEFSDNLFVVMKMLSCREGSFEILSEQISFVLGKGYVLSFQERPGDVLNTIRERIRSNLGRVRRSGADYLLYTLLDVILDNYFTVLDQVSEQITSLEQEVITRPRGRHLFMVQRLRGQLIMLGKHVTPTRELIGRLTTMDHPLIEQATHRYINDLQDHTAYIADNISSMRDQLASLENTYHAMVNLKMSQVMKVLTVVSSIFIPLTFLAGLYGMNFRVMPELEWTYGYPAVLMAMVVLATGMIIWLRRRKWL